MKSHVQLPSFILKKFRDSSNKKGVYYYSFKDEIVTYRSIRSIGTKKNYYYDNIEKDLSRSVENDMGSFLNRIIKKLDQGDMIALSKKDTNIITNYLYINHIRSEEALRIFNEDSLTSDLLTTKQTIMI